MKDLRPFLRLTVLLGILVLPILQLACAICLFGDCTHEGPTEKVAEHAERMTQDAEPLPPCHAAAVPVEPTPPAPCDDDTPRCEPEVLPQLLASFPQVDRAFSSQESQASFGAGSAAPAMAKILGLETTPIPARARPGTDPPFIKTPSQLFTLHSSWLL